MYAYVYVYIYMYIYVNVYMYMYMHTYATIPIPSGGKLGNWDIDTGRLTYHFNRINLFLILSMGYSLW